MSKRLGIYWPDLLVVLNTESGISPAALNPGGAAGLIQFKNLPGVGWNRSSQEFRALSDVAQLPYVERFLAPYAKYNLNSIGRIHQVLLGPATLPLGGDKDKNFVVYRKNGKRWNGEEASYYEGADMESWDLAHAASPNSPYQRAFARLKVLLPEYAQRVGPMASTKSRVAAVGFLALAAGAWYYLSGKSRSGYRRVR
jgi:hypothetical protein